MFRILMVCWCFLGIYQVTQAQTGETRLQRADFYYNGFSVLYESELVLSEAGVQTLTLTTFLPDTNPLSAIEVVRGDAEVIAVGESLVPLYPALADSVAVDEAHTRQLESRITAVRQEMESLEEQLRRSDRLLMWTNDDSWEQRLLRLDSVAEKTHGWIKRLEELEQLDGRLDAVFSTISTRAWQQRCQLQYVRQVKVVLSANKAGAVQLHWTLYSTASHWMPYYELRYKRVGAPLELTYGARVYNHAISMALARKRVGFHPEVLPFLQIPTPYNPQEVPTSVYKHNIRESGNRACPSSYNSYGKPNFFLFYLPTAGESPSIVVEDSAPVLEVAAWSPAPYESLKSGQRVALRRYVLQGRYCYSTWNPHHGMLGSPPVLLKARIATTLLRGHHWGEMAIFEGTRYQGSYILAVPPEQEWMDLPLGNALEDDIERHHIVEDQLLVKAAPNYNTPDKAYATVGDRKGATRAKKQAVKAKLIAGEVYYNGLTAHYRSEVTLEEGWHLLTLQTSIDQLAQSTEVEVHGAGITIHEVRDSMRVTDPSLQDATDRAADQYYTQTKFNGLKTQTINRWARLVKVLTNHQDQLEGEKVPAYYQRRLKGWLATTNTQLQALERSLKTPQPFSKEVSEPLEYGNEVRLLVHVAKAGSATIHWNVHTKRVHWKPVYDLSHEGRNGPVVWRTYVQVIYHRLWDLFNDSPLTFHQRRKTHPPRLVCLPSEPPKKIDLIYEKDVHPISSQQFICQQYQPYNMALTQQEKRDWEPAVRGHVHARIPSDSIRAPLRHKTSSTWTLSHWPILFTSISYQNVMQLVVQEDTLPAKHIYRTALKTGAGVGCAYYDKEPAVRMPIMSMARVPLSAMQSFVEGPVMVYDSGRYAGKFFWRGPEAPIWPDANRMDLLLKELPNAHAVRTKQEAVPTIFKDSCSSVGRVYKTTLYNQDQQPIEVELVDFLPGGETAQGRLVWVDDEGLPLDSDQPWVRTRTIPPQSEEKELLGYQIYYRVSRTEGCPD